jgi:peptide/nickel transport system substrate-binding protein
VLFDPANPRRLAEFTLIRDSAARAGFVVTDCSDPAWMDLLGVGGAYDAALFGWNEAVPAVTGLESRLGRASTVTNFSGYSNPDVDALLASVSRSDDPEVQHESLVSIDETLWKDAYGLPLYQYPAITAWSERVSEVAPSALAPGVFWNIWDWQPAAKSPSPAPSR